MRQYEAMFLFDSAVIGDLASAKTEVDRILKRAEAEIIVCRRWDERKLAYTIGGCKRGLYLLAFFRADPVRIREIERDIRLSERVVRALVLKADWITEARMHEVLPERLDHFTPQSSAPVETERSRPPEEEEFEGSEAVTIDADVQAANRG